MNPKTEFEKQIGLGQRQLKKSCPTMASWINQTGACLWEVAWERSIHEALIRAVAHQQLHSKAAESILKRLIDRFPRRSFPSAAQVVGLPLEELRALGFSQAKALAIQGIAQAALDRRIPTRKQAELLSDEQLIDRLLPLRGVGRWTVQMLLIFTLGRLDVMPVDDFGIRAGLADLYGRNQKVSPSTIRSLTEAWAPYRSVGAWYLWRRADKAKVRKATETA
jgi:DNA-3-methyladenine glycosylase II